MDKQTTFLAHCLCLLGALVIFSPGFLNADCCGFSEMKDAKDDQQKVAFQALQQDFARLKAIYKQQPDNQKALEKASLSLKRRATTLRAAVEPQPSPTEKSETSAEPGGPVKPSQKPSSPEEIQKRIEATEGQFLRTPLEGNQPVPLAGVSKHKLTLGCELIEERINLLVKELQNAPNENAIRQHLASIEKLIHHIGTSPSSDESPPKNNSASKS